MCHSCWKHLLARFLPVETCVLHALTAPLKTPTVPRAWAVVECPLHPRIIPSDPISPGDPWACWRSRLPPDPPVLGGCTPPAALRVPAVPALVRLLRPRSGLCVRPAPALDPKPTRMLSRCVGSGMLPDTAVFPCASPRCLRGQASQTVRATCPVCFPSFFSFLFYFLGFCSTSSTDLNFFLTLKEFGCVST